MRKRNLFIVAGLLAGALLLAACGQAASNIESAGSASADVQETADAQESADTQASSNAESISNPWTDSDTLEEAEQNSGITITLPEKIDGYTIKDYRSMDGMIEIVYQGANADDTLTIRKGTGSDEISGDYSKYQYQISVSTEENGSVVYKGANDSLINSATWSRDGYQYAVLVNPGTDNGIPIDKMGHILSRIDQDDSAASGTSQGTDNNQQTVVDASDYFSEEDSLVSLLDMHPIDSWQFGGAAYEADGFKIEYATEDDGIMFSMSNEGNNSVSLYGINLGDSLSDAEQKLDSYGWTPSTSSTPHMEFYKELNGKYFVLDLNESGESDTTVESWYINNWPQGEYDFSCLTNQTGEK